MRATILLLTFAVPFLVAAQASARSCSAFGVVKAYDAAAGTVEIEFTKMKATEFFPRPEGASGDITKIPKKCKRSLLKESSFPVKSTGGRMSVTQIRNNLSGKMLNDTESAEWFKAEMDKLVAGGGDVAIVLRPGNSKKDPAQVTTIYLAATEEDFAEIARLEAQASDVE